MTWEPLLFLFCRWENWDVKGFTQDFSLFVGKCLWVFKVWSRMEPNIDWGEGGRAVLRSLEAYPPGHLKGQLQNFSQESWGRRAAAVCVCLEGTLLSPTLGSRSGMVWRRLKEIRRLTQHPQPPIIGAAHHEVREANNIRPWLLSDGGAVRETSPLLKAPSPSL